MVKPHRTPFSSSGGIIVVFQLLNVMDFPLSTSGGFIEGFIVRVMVGFILLMYDPWVFQSS